MAKKTSLKTKTATKKKSAKVLRSDAPTIVPTTSLAPTLATTLATSQNNALTNTTTNGKYQGRNTKLNAEVEDRFLQAIRLGCPINDACGCAGINPATYYRWLEKAEDESVEKYQVYRNFREKVKEVEGEATRSWLAVIEKAAREGTWQAAAWKLERRRNMFIPKIRQEVTGKDGESIKIEQKKSADEARAIISSAITGYATAGTTTADTGETDPTTTH